MKFGIRKPSLKGRISARTSPKRFLRHNIGLKAPRGFGWFTNPKKAAYNRIYNRTSFGCSSLAVPGIFIAALFFVGSVVLVAIVRTPFVDPPRSQPSSFKPDSKLRGKVPSEKAELSSEPVASPSVVPRYPSNSTGTYARPNVPLPSVDVPYNYYSEPSYKGEYRSPYRPPDGAPKTVNVRGYHRKDGTYVRPHTRRAPRSRY